MRTVSEIELRSYQILRSRVDTSGLPVLTRAVLERVIHASADLDYLTDLAVSAEADLRAGWQALRAGAPVVADVQMVAAGITARRAVCHVAQAVAAPGETRSAAAIRLALAEVGPGAVWVIGNAPTALDALLAVDARPALVIGLPVGFVGAVEAKRRCASGLPAVSNASEKGGSAVAAAAVNALLYAEDP